MGKLFAATQVLDNLYLGSLEDAESLCLANERGISTVISLCREPVRCRAINIKYLHFPVRDERPISIAWLNAILTAIEEGMAQGPVLVHCGAGMSRAPSVVAAYLDRMGFLGFVRALSYLEEIRPVVAPSRKLVESIERELNNSWEVKVYR